MKSSQYRQYKQVYMQTHNLKIFEFAFLLANITYPLIDLMRLRQWNFRKGLKPPGQEITTILMYGRNHEMMGASSEKNLRGSTA
jgi:hypothetical protein